MIYLISRPLSELDQPFVDQWLSQQQHLGYLPAGELEQPENIVP